MFKNALVSCSNKNGLIEFLKPLVARGMRVVSTGGTAKHLIENNIPVIQVSEQTGFPEVMDGRVRTLHPRIHMPLLARSFDESDQKLLRDQGLESFDLVVGNLYPFEESLKEGLSGQELIEQIDIGGPTLLRAAAKSFESITVLCDPDDYKFVGAKRPTLSERQELAAKVFSHISVYDALVAEILGTGRASIPSGSMEPISDELFSAKQALGATLIHQLRYGENPHQKAAWYKRSGHRGLHDARILQGKELSYNNLLDLQSCIEACRSFNRPCAVAVKHNNPCGIAESESAYQAVDLALKADPVSVFGGVIAVNRVVDSQMAERLSQVFLECIVAPGFDAKAIEIFARKRNLRLLQWDFNGKALERLEHRLIEGGLLVQEKDVTDRWSEQWRVLGEKPSSEVQRDLLFAWNVCQHLKSNAIAVVSGSQTLGLGMGQVNRVDAVRHALERMSQHHGNRSGAVLASDAFFPFPDSVELIAQAGVHWIIQPGGSVKDEEVFSTAAKLKVNMILTGKRHFRH